jgi:hypothetical protein
VNEWILFCQQTAVDSGIGDNSLAATIVSGAAMIVTAMLKLMPEKGKATEVPESVDMRLRLLEADFARFAAKIEERLDNQGKTSTQMAADLRELYQALRDGRLHQGGD